MKKKEGYSGVGLGPDAMKAVYAKIQKPFTIYTDSVKKTFWAKDIDQAKDRFKSVYGDKAIRGVVAI